MSLSVYVQLSPKLFIPLGKLKITPFKSEYTDLVNLLLGSIMSLMTYKFVEIMVGCTIISITMKGQSILNLACSELFIPCTENVFDAIAAKQ